MKRICAWCGKVTKEGNGTTSHGICSDCAADPSILAASGLREFINQFSFPVLVLNDLLETVALNSPAQSSLGPNIDIVADHSIGVVVDCVNSHQCGRAVHCSGCVLRHTIEKTQETGVAGIRVPAVLSTLRSEVHYYVTTIKHESHVLVKLEKA
jgi:hypothetical protein